MLNDFRDIQYRPQSVAPGLILWLMALEFLTLGTVLVGTLATTAPPRNEANVLAPVVVPPTFSEAVASMRSGRHAEAYATFAALADQGDIDSARMALLMYRFGPTVFGNLWDASPGQIAQWTLMSRKAEERDLAHVRSTPAQAADRLAMQRLAN